MTNTSIPNHSDIPERYTWNAASVFPSVAAWETELKSVTASLPQVKQYQGRLAEGSAILADALAVLETLMRRVGKLYVYAYMSHQVDTNDQVATRMNGQALGLFGQAMAATSFLQPELLAIGLETLRRWIAEEPRLAYLTHYVEDLFRKQAHVRSAEVEELLGMLADPFTNLENTMGMLTNADFKFEPVVDSAGSKLPLTQGSLHKILATPDRAPRRHAWNSYHDLYRSHKNALASNLATSIKANVFQMRARRHPSTLAAALFEPNIPTEVFHNLVATVRRNFPTWQRYFAIRRKALGVKTLHPYDMWAPLTSERPAIPYEQAVDWICQGLAPLGQEYVATIRRGCLEERWVDAMPCQGKTAGAFSSGWAGTYPFILMSYGDEVFSLSTLAHELGHSMHSYLTWQNQPLLYSQYSMFVAETASNFHQAMVRAYLLEHNPDQRVPDRPDRRGNGELLPLLFYHAHAGPFRAGDPRAGGARPGLHRGRCDGALRRSVRGGVWRHRAGGSRPGGHGLVNLRPPLH